MHASYAMPATQTMLCMLAMLCAGYTGHAMHASYAMPATQTMLCMLAIALNILLFLNCHRSCTSKCVVMHTR